MRAIFAATDIPQPPETVAGHRALLETLTEAQQFYMPRSNLTPGFVEVVIDESVLANQVEALQMVHSLVLSPDVRGLGQYYYDVASATIFRRGGWVPRPQIETIIADVPIAFKSLRTIQAILADIKALTSAQQANINADLFGASAKYRTDTGSGEDAISVLEWAILFAGAAPTSVTEAKFRAAAFYVRDNPSYLVHPAFDPTINLSGIG